MTTTEAEGWATEHREAARTSASPLQLPFASTIGLSAFLLFSLELLAARLLLPVFGGSPGVWTTSLCFFTAVLFVGYAYADALVSRLSARRAAFVHLALAAVAVVLTILAPSDIASLRNAALPEALNVILVLAVIAAGPAFLLATTTPLLSAWFAGHGGSPWWLYATSNGASFVALLAYPILIEPLLPLSAQRLLFSVGFALMASLLAAVVVAGRGRRNVAAGRSAAADGSDRSQQIAGADESDRNRRIPGAVGQTPAVPDRDRLGLRRQALWLAAAFVPAGLLSATTNYLQTDLLSAPLIWVGPLAIYLASFVVAFSARGRRWVPRVDRLVPAAATLLWVPYLQPGVWPVLPLLVVELGSFFVVAVAVHGHLAFDLPHGRHVTRFYLVLSAGGMLATAFVALLAPLVFSSVYEYPLLVVGGLIVLALLPATDAGLAQLAGPTRGRAGSAILRNLASRLVPYALVGLPLVLLIARQDEAGAGRVLGFLLFGSIAVLAALTPRLFAGVTAVVLAAAILSTSASPLLRVRTFFGVVEVRTADAAHLEISGTTLHGVQFTDARRDEPTTYYVADGSMGEVFRDLRSRTTNARVGVVGLGVGTIAAYAKVGDVMTFYEINQAVIDIARNPAYFTFLADAPTPPRVVVGDARLSLLHEPSGSFDLLILDAFTSDAVPAHLLTREAIASYTRTLAPGGLIAFHLSNRYYDLAAAVAATSRANGLDAVVRGYVPSSELASRLSASPSIWLVVGASPVTAPFRNTGWEEPHPGPVLTDDYSDLMRTLRLNGLI